MAACLPLCFAVSFLITSHPVGRRREEGVEREGDGERRVEREKERERERERERKKGRELLVYNV